MNAFLKSKAGVLSVLAFAAMMGVAFHHVASGRRARSPQAKTSPPTEVTAATPALATPASSTVSTVPIAAAPATPEWNALAENTAYLEKYYELGRREREDHDRQGNPLTRRENAATPRDVGFVPTTDEAPEAPVSPLRSSLRLQGRPRPPEATRLRTAVAAAAPVPQAAATVLPPASRRLDPAADTMRGPGTHVRPKRFNPYGNVLKCELVFTIDSTNEQTPLVGIVMEPVYNNGVLVIPAGTELHGTARPDRLRDRIFSGSDWVLVFPRERERPNGRQLNVKGVALDRVEPDTNGMTWGITDGSYGLEGRVIRTMNEEEIKRFVATFIAASTVALQEKQPSGRDRDTFRNTPQNAVLQGLAANFQQIASDITAEIAAHGVFIRVPAGHQFYFYPTQIIDADAADISSDVATVK